MSESKLRYFSLEVQRSDKYRIDRFSSSEKKNSYLAMFINFKRKEFPSFKHKKNFEVDISVFNSQWQKKVVELALLYSIRDYIRSGDIFARE